MPRLGHKKSRNGCRQCKARHVKCDESKPCSNCARHGVQCSLVTWDPTAPPPTPIKREPGTTKKATKTLNSIPERSKKLSSTSLPIDYVLNPSPDTPHTSSESSSPYSQNDTYSFLSRFSNKTGSSQTDSWVRDLELMHHWTIRTYYFLTPNANIRTFWCIETPKLAVHYPFLMHEILAISAFHKAYLEPEERSKYYELGIHHQDLAIKETRKALPSLGADNAGAMFATGAIISLTAFAATGLGARSGSTKPGSAVDDLVDIFALQQGMFSILSQNHAHVTGGPFAALLSDAEEGESEEPEQPLLISISAQIATVAAFLEAQPLAAPVRSETLGALSWLKFGLDSSNAPRTTSRDLRFLFYWPNRLSPVYCSMLRRKEPAALVVLAYYAVACRAAESFYWFMEGWAERIVRAIADELAIDPRWRPILQWPWNCIMGTPQDSVPERGPEQPPHDLLQPLIQEHTQQHTTG